MHIILSREVVFLSLLCRSRLHRNRISGTCTTHLSLFGLDYSSVIGISDESDKGNSINNIENNKSEQSTIEVPLSWYKLASNRPVSLSPAERDMVQSLAERSHETIPDLPQRAKWVSWGGPHNTAPEVSWWPQQKSTDPTMISSHEAGQLIHSSRT